MSKYFKSKSQSSDKPDDARSFLKETALFLVDVLYNAVIIILLVVLIRNFLISPFRVIGSSMADTLQSNEFILIDKLSYHLSEPKRGDAIVFRPPITNKYPHKFEEVITADANGVTTLDLSPLHSTKPVIYCQNEWVAKLWICQDSVKEGDILFIRPAINNQLTQDDTEWRKAEQRLITKGESESKTLEVQAQPNQMLGVRIYDAEGPEYFVKRIIGVPGDTVKIENGNVYLKTMEADTFTELKEDYLNDSNLGQTYFSQNTEENTFVVPEGSYFTMGDNRNHSNDSRSWFAPITQEHTPFVPLNNINGKVLVVLWPTREIRVIPGAVLE